jgi:hypothetical protein
LTGVTDYGVSMDAILASQEAIPLHGLALDGRCGSPGSQTGTRSASHPLRRGYDLEVDSSGIQSPGHQVSARRGMVSVFRRQSSFSVGKLFIGGNFWIQVAGLVPGRSRSERAPYLSSASCKAFSIARSATRIAENVLFAILEFT